MAMGLSRLAQTFLLLLGLSPVRSESIETFLRDAQCSRET